jgi:hypothetical protein
MPHRVLYVKNLSWQRKRKVFSASPLSKIKRPEISPRGADPLPK